MKKLILASTALALAACNGDGDAAGGNADLPVADAPIENVEAPEGQEWSEVVTMTDAGGYLMGNPDAPIKLVEYGSMTCGACARFDAEGTEPLIEDYVKSGRVSYEYRNYTRDVVDITASLLARCGAEGTFFPLTHAMFGAQQQWFGESIPQLQAIQGQLNAAAPAEQFKLVAETTGLKTFAAQRGLPAAKADACLADEAAASKLVAIKNVADTDYNISGTPTFLINNRVVEGANQWPGLQPILAAAVGEPAGDAAE